MNGEKPSKGPWILVAVVFLLLAALWAAFIVFAEQHKPEPIELPAAASDH
jgi:hypothetical protein